MEAKKAEYDVNIKEGSDLGTAEDLNDSEVIVGWRTWMAVVAGCSCPFTAFYLAITLGLYYGVAATALEASALGAWLPNAYALVTVIGAPTVAVLSDKLGRRYFILGGAALTFAGCIMIGAAKNIGTGIAGSVLVAGLFSQQGNFFAIPAEVLPRRYRGIAMTLTIFGAGFSSVMAALVNGVLIRDSGDWRSGYYIGAGSTAMTFTLIAIFYHPKNPERKKPVAEILRCDIDWVGIVLLTCFVVPLMLGLTWGGSEYAWSSAPVIASLALGGAFLLILIAHQVWMKTGLFHKDVFRHRNYQIAFLGLFVEGVVLNGFLIFAPIATAQLWESDAFMVTVRLIPFFLGYLFGPIAGFYTRRTKDMRNPLLLGWGFILVSIIVLATLGTSSAASAASIAMLCIAGIGFSVPFSLLNAVGQLACPPELLGQATGLFISFRALGTAVGTVLLVAVYSIKITAFLPEYVTNAAIAGGVPTDSIAGFVGGIAGANATLLASTAGLTPSMIELGQTASKQAYVKAVHLGWFTVMPFAILVLISTVFIDVAALRRQMNWLVERPVEEIRHVTDADRGHADA